jgi:hypothetical protein
VIGRKEVKKKKKGQRELNRRSMKGRETIGQRRKGER